MTPPKQINFTELRKKFSVPADHMRIIIKEIGFKVERVGTEQFVVGNNPYNVDNEYFLKHAILEYRLNMNCDETKRGNFKEYEIKTQEGIGRIGISTFSDDAFTARAGGIVNKPTEPTSAILGPVNTGRELMRTGVEMPLEAAAQDAPDALQVLVSALQAVQQPQRPPDPLQAHRDLLEACEKKFLLTGEQLGVLLGFSKSTITSKKSGFKKMGFEFSKVKEGSTTLWAVRQY